MVRQLRERILVDAAFALLGIFAMLTGFLILFTERGSDMRHFLSDIHLYLFLLILVAIVLHHLLSGFCLPKMIKCFFKLDEKRKFMVITDILMGFLWLLVIMTAIDWEWGPIFFDMSRSDLFRYHTYFSYVASFLVLFHLALNENRIISGISCYFPPPEEECFFEGEYEFDEGCGDECMCECDD